jgi:hypothetical protein
MTKIDTVNDHKREASGPVRRSTLVHEHHLRRATDFFAGLAVLMGAKAGPLSLLQSAEHRG